MNKIKKIIEKYIKGNLIFTRFIKVFSVDVLVRGSNFLLIPIFLRLMSPVEYGLYGYLYSFAMTMAGILGFGFYVSLTKLYADSQGDAKTRGSMLFTLTSSLYFLLILSVLLIYLLKLDMDFFSFLNSSSEIDSNHYFIYRNFIFIAIVSMVISNFLTFYLVSSEKILGLQTFNLLRFFLTNFTAILVIYFSSGDTVFQRLAVTYSMEIILTMFFSIIIYKNIHLKFNLYFLKKAFKIGIPVMVSSIMYAVINFGDKYFVIKYSGELGMSIYYLSFLLATIVLIIYQSFNFIWSPLFMKEKDLRVLKRKTNRYLFIISFGFSLIGVFIWLGSFVGLKLNIIPSDYIQILELLPLLIISQIIAAMALLMLNFMTYFEKTYIQVFVGAGLSIIGYFIFNIMGENFGVIGIAISLVFLNLIQFLFFYFRVQYYINNRLKA